MTTYDIARTALYNATMYLIESQQRHSQVRDAIARELRGTKAALSEAQKDELNQRMQSDHADVLFMLYDAERMKAECQLAFDLADNEAKNARRDTEYATAEMWMEISDRLLQAAQLNSGKPAPRADLYHLPPATTEDGIELPF